MDMPHRLDTPRIAPLEPELWDTKLREQMLPARPVEMGAADAPVFNIFKTLANHSKLAARFARWGDHVLFRSSLPPRDREIAILRVGWRCRATYEWHHHVAIGRDHAGLDDADFARIMAGPEAEDLSARDRWLLRAVDELIDDHCVCDATWAGLSQSYDTAQLMDLVFAVGSYAMVSMALNSFGVQLEDAYR